MYTTGLANEGMSELYEANRLADALQDARRRTLAFYAHLDLAARVPYLATINPPIWELAHLAWFQEFWCLRYWPDDPAGKRTPSILPNADALFDSRSVAHADRWRLSYPSPEGIERYMEDTLERSLEALDEGDSERRYFFELAMRHEDMHGEALLMTLQTLGLPPPRFAADGPPRSVPTGRPREVMFDGGEFLLGTLPDSPHFTFDNEKWAHMVSMRPFSMSLDPVTQGEFAAFTEEGGYRRSELWTPEGWRWRGGERLESPRYWKREGSGWSARRFDEWLPIDFAAPMVHVSLHEALAFCRWAERRLPTEAEWEFAARNGGAAARYPWGDAPPVNADGLDCRYLAASSGIRDPAPSGTGLRQLIGGVWEWTSTPFAPYPGFRADPYKEYSQPWFRSHYVLRGGSFATRARLVHSRFRNFYLPERADVFCGFRTCAVS
jgi:iron(II)-dependent oxidoreductase